MAISMACLEACLAACLILAKCLFCSTFHRIHGNVHSLDHPSQPSVCFAPLSIASMAISLAKCTFHSINGNFLILAKSLSFAAISIASYGNFHSLKACLQACLEACLDRPRGKPPRIAKCLFCCNFHSIASNFHSPKAGLKLVSGPTVCM